MRQLDMTIAVAALTVILVATLSARLERAPASRPMLALLLGLAAGPQAFGLLRPDLWPDPHLILKEAARLTLAISVAGIAIRTPFEHLRPLLRPLGLLLTLGMLAMWAVSAGLAWGFLGVAPLTALLIGAAVTPTDPVVASSIVTGATAEAVLPERLRSLMSLESGANDGLAYAIVLLPALLMTEPDQAWETWLLDTVVVGVGFAAAIGAGLGWAAARALRRSGRLGWIARSSLLGFTLALSFAAVSLAKLFGSDGILAAFAAGLTFNGLVDRRHHDEAVEVQEAIVSLLTLPVFVLFGAMLPWSSWLSLGWPALGLAAATLALRRPAAVALATLFAGREIPRRDRLFLGWFGPIGVAALYYAIHGHEETGDPTLWPAVSLMVAASVLAHGLTSWPGLASYRRRLEAAR